MKHWEEMLQSSRKMLMDSVGTDRSRIMRSIKGKDTKPELKVRRLVHALGYRYRLHRRDLPGQPDIVFGAKRKLVFVHGCFWHGHSCKRGSRKPKTNLEYWSSKIQKNMTRDKSNLRDLQKQGWEVLIVWECELNHATLEDRLVTFLGPTGRLET
ncbi:very short patch repair endonuclease [Roseibium sp.]|uniref:very short patch repair endonuclease n=1 Tax=Roseibium sp. TaxID=1936156 RepID=UPI0039F0ED09